MIKLLIKSSVVLKSLSFRLFNFNTKSNEIQVKLILLKAEFSKGFNVDNTQIIWLLKEDSTSHPNTNKDI